FGIKRFELVG
ncbi:unnamed protein product, partial [Allacma fusca]